MKLAFIAILAFAFAWLLMSMAMRTAERIAQSRVELVAP